MTFNSRQHAGRLLAEELRKRNIRPDLVFGLARGGVVVAAEIAAAFRVPLKPLIVRKISPPGNPEFALGAIAGRNVWWDEDTIHSLRLSPQWQKQQIEDKKIEISEYIRKIGIHKNIRRSSKKLLNIVLVDDGAATGISMMAAIGVIRKVNKGQAFRREAWPYQITVALPVASIDAAAKIKLQADETVILSVDPDFRAVGEYFREFNQVSWEEVKILLQLNNEAYRKAHPQKTPQKHDRSGVGNKRG